MTPVPSERHRRPRRHSRRSGGGRRKTATPRGNGTPWRAGGGAMKPLLWLLLAALSAAIAATLLLRGGLPPVLRRDRPPQSKSRWSSRSYRPAPPTPANARASTTPPHAGGEGRADDDDGVVSRNSRKRPLFVVHVGPPKTGSTTLQCALSSLRPELEKDSYHYRGKHACSTSLWGRGDGFLPSLFGSCLRRTAQAMQTRRRGGTGGGGGGGKKADRQPPRCWSQFRRELRSRREMGHNLIVSEEAISINVALGGGGGRYFHGDLGGYPWELLSSALDGWDVRIVVTYRPYFEWLPSVYNQANKFTQWAKEKLQKWPTETDGGGGSGGAGGRRVVEFSEFFDRVRARGYADYPSPSRAVADFGKSNFTISVIHLLRGPVGEGGGGGGDAVKQFLCDVLPDAHRACAAWSSSSDGGDVNVAAAADSSDAEGGDDADGTDDADGARKNPSVALHYDFVAVAAHKAGLVRPGDENDDGNCTRPLVREAARRRHEDDLGLSPRDFPARCLAPEQEEALFEMSVEEERKMFPRWYNHSGDDNGMRRRAELRGMFDGLLAEGTFCSVDTDEVLRDDGWRDFFASLQCN